MKLPKLCPLEHMIKGVYVIAHANGQLTESQAAECIRRVELHDELVEALDWAMRYGDWAEACDGNPIMKIAYARAQAVLNKSQGA